MSRSKQGEGFPEEEITTRLQRELPRWQLNEGGLHRRFKTGGWKGTLLVVNTIGHLAEAAFHHPDLAISYAEVRIRLLTHSAGGVTDKDFELARKIEEVITWRPGDRDGALEGTPDDPRFKYLIYDEPG